MKFSAIATVTWWVAVVLICHKLRSRGTRLACLLFTVDTTICQHRTCMIHPARVSLAGGASANSVHTLVCGRQDPVFSSRRHIHWVLFCHPLLPAT
jgi:hypothetical protein